MGNNVTTYSLCVDWRDVEATIVIDLDKLKKVSACTVSKLIDGVHDGGGEGTSTYRRPVYRGLVYECRVSYLFKLVGGLGE